jgi:hypothetical protein
VAVVPHDSVVKSVLHEPSQGVWEQRAIGGPERLPNDSSSCSSACRDSIGPTGDSRSVKAAHADTIATAASPTAAIRRDRVPATLADTSRMASKFAPWIAMRSCAAWRVSVSAGRKSLRSQCEDAAVASGLPFSTTYVAMIFATPVPRFVAVWTTPAGMMNESPAFTVTFGLPACSRTRLPSRT